MSWNLLYFDLELAYLSMLWLSYLLYIVTKLLSCSLACILELPFYSKVFLIVCHGLKYEL